jgi:hypothetical protein
MVNVMHFVDQSGTTQQIVDGLRDNLGANAVKPISVSYTLARIELLPLDGTTGTTSAVPTTVMHGGGGTQFIPAGTCCVTEHTGLRGRSHRGRIFLPALDEDQMQDGIMVDAGTIEAGWNTVLPLWDADPHSGSLVVASYLLASADLVLSCSVNAAAATQRRRQSRLR